MAVTVTVTIQLEGFLTLKEVEGAARVSTLRAGAFQGPAGLSGANAETATSKSLKER